MAEVTASGAMVAARGTFDKTIDVVVRIFVPVAGVIAGFFLPTVLGGGASIGSMINKGAGGTGQWGRLGWGIQAIINALVGGAFWSLRRMDGLVAKAIGGAVGGFFLGGALGCIPGVLQNTSIPEGLIDKLAGGIREAAQEG